jgi:hypothetical protein
MRRLQIHLMLAMSALWFVAVSAIAADTPSSDRTLDWQQTETMLTLMHGDRMVWQHVHDRRVGKPFMRIGLLDGTELTRPWPIPDDYPKRDHTWHRALWWSWKWIDGVNYWEQHQEGTEPVDVRVQALDDHSAKIVLTIHYHQPDRPPVVKETRTISVSPPDDGGNYHVDWTAEFTAAGDQPVVFGQNSYGGLAIRFSALCCGDSGAGRPAWVFRDDQGRENQTNDRQARWVAYSGQTPSERAAAVAVFDHPENPRHPAFWQLRNQYPYLNPSLTCKESFTLEKDRALTLRYRIAIFDGPATPETIEQAWQSFVEENRY